jgi:hypothetical protein
VGFERNGDFSPVDVRRDLRHDDPHREYPRISVMKRVLAAVVCGFCITILIFAAHLTVTHWFSWKDKPMMPNVFTYLLLPGSHLAATIPAPSPLRLGLAIAFDCVLFSVPIWLLLQVRHLVTERSH